MVFGIGAALGAVIAYFWPKQKPFRVVAVQPTACKLTGNCPQGAPQYELVELGSYLTIDAAVAASTAPCPPSDQLRVIVGPGPAGIDASLTAIVPRNDGTCYASVSLAADIVQAASARGLHIPAVVPA